jgi:cytochrome c2
MKRWLILVFILTIVDCSSRVSAQQTSVVDKQAEYYFYTCAGCHTVGGGNLTGPDLMTSTQWNKEDLKSAIKKMEKNVGPMSAEDVEQMVEFLKDLSVQDRIAKQREQIESTMRANMPPASFEMGERLFRGEKRLVNGGSACMSCHQFVNHGGTLGIDLTRVKDRISGVALQSGIQNASYKIMRAIYAKHPITQEEALHLAEYLSHPEKVQTRPGPMIEKIVVWAASGFGVFFVLLWILNRNRKGCTREKLLQKSMKE